MLSKPLIMAQVRDWLTAFPITTASVAAFATAFSAFEAGRFGLWDALLLATAGEAGCTIVLSEDMGDGASLDGTTVRNPLRGDALPDDLRPLLGLP